MKYHLITMGCPKNKVDSDGIEMLLRAATYDVAPSPQEADILIVNTCGFLEAAKEESIGMLQELGRHKRRHQILIAAGCLAQRNGDEVLARVPKVDGLQQIRGGDRRSKRRLQRYSLLGDPADEYAIAVPMVVRYEVSAAFW